MPTVVLKSSETRAQILDAAEKIMVAEGYAGVTSRAVAARVGINPGLVHYYFPSLDDLFVAVVRRGGEKNLERVAAALSSATPLISLWRLTSDPRGVAVLHELIAASNHRKALRSQVAQFAEAARRLQVEAFSKILPEYDIDPKVFPPQLVAAAIQGMALLVVQEKAIGASTGQPVATKALERLLQKLEDRRRTEGR